MALTKGLVRLRGRLRDLVAGDPPSDAPTCNAPFASMYLDQRGDVRACCQNAGWPLGNVTERPLSEIWHSEKAARLRAAVGVGDLSLGCNFCRWQLEDGSDDAIFARMFDHLDPDCPEPAWPQQLELSLSNACNLQCVMCNGEWSSSIRTHRERLPPLPKVYDESFFADLEQFLPHLRVVKFLGGEPFLGAESLRVMDMLARSGLDIEVHVTTNGTQWSPRIERLLDRLDVHVVVSLDGVEADTYESIRLGSSLETVVANVDRFVEYARRRGLGFSLSHCLMTSNWHEFDRFLDFAEERRAEVYVNTVTEPYDLSLYHLSPAGLRCVLDDLRDRDEQTRGRLTGPRRAVWADQLERLGRHLEMLGEHRPPDYVAKRRELGFAWLAPPERSADALARLARAVEDEPGWTVDIDLDGAILAAVVGAPGTSDALSTAIDRLRREGVAHGLREDPSVPDDGSVVREDLHTYQHRLPSGQDDVEVVVLRAALRDDDGVLVGARVFLRDPDPGVDERDVRQAAAAAAEAMGGDEVVTLGLRLDTTGLVEEVIGDPAALGITSTPIDGRPVAELAELLAAGVGRPEGELEDVRTTPRVRHQMQHLRGENGRRSTVHVFTGPGRHGAEVWLIQARAGRDGA